MYPVREQNKINKRKAILEAAIKLFSRKGYDQTSIEELAREAGIGKGTVYSYFQTKKEIVHAFCEEELDFTRSQLAAHTNPDSSLQEQLLVLFMAEFTHITENRDFGRIYLQESIFPREHHGVADLEMQNQYFEMLYPIYRKAQHRGEISSDLELLHIAGHFYALNLLILSCWYNGMIPTEEIPEAMTTLINQVIDGLKPKTAKVIAR